MRKKFLMIILLLMVQITFSQTSAAGKIKGTALDENKSPVEYVKVTIQDLGLTAFTDNKGNYEFSNIPVGKYILTFSRSGYKTVSIEAVINEKEERLDVYLAESLIETPVIDVTSSFNVIDISKSTFSVTEITSREITSGRSETLAETIKNVPGINNISTGIGLGKPVIRGLSFQSVLIVHDGVKHESQMWGDEHGPELSLFDIDRIEILRGPASLVYGADGIGGVVNVISKPLEFSLKNKPVIYGEVNLGGFSVNTQGVGSLTLGIGTKDFGVKGHFGYREGNNVKTPDGTFTVNTLNGRRTISGGELFNSGNKELQGGASIGFNGKPGKINFGFDIFNREVQLHEDPLEAPGATPSQKLNTSQFSFEGSLILSKQLKLEPVLSYQMQERREFESIEDKEADITALNLKINTFDGTLKLDHDINKNISGTFGVSYINQKNESLAEEKLIPNYDANTFSIFLLEKINTKYVTLSAGARYDTKNLDVKETVFEYDSLGNPLKILLPQELTFNAVSGSFGMAYNPNKNISVFSNIGRGWRPPSEFELFVDGVHEGTGRYDRGLRTIDSLYEPKPEESLNLDLGFRINYKILSIQVSAYRNMVNNFVYPSPTVDTIDGFPVYNIMQDKSTFIGYEYSIQFQPLKWLVLTANGDYVKTKNEATGNPLPFSPPVKNIFEINLQRKEIEKLSNPYIKFGVKVVSPQKDVDPLETATAGYSLLSAGIGFDFAMAKSIASVDLSVDNIANTKYVDHLSRYKSYALNPGRSFSLQINVPFRF